MTKDEIRKLFATHSVPLGQKDVWEVQGTPVIKHAALERLSAALKLQWSEPVVVRADRDEAVMLVKARRPDGIEEWSFGEALVGVNYRVSGKQAAYVWAMCEKRGKDRVIIKLAGLHGAYSDEESENLKEGKADANDNAAPEPEEPPQARGDRQGAADPAEALKQRINACAAINTVTDLMLAPETQAALNAMAPGPRDEVREHAKARLVALGWPARSRGRRRPDEPDDPDTAGDPPAVQGAEDEVSRAPEPDTSAPTSSDEPDPFGDLDDSLDGPVPFNAGAFLRDAERRFAEARTFAEIDEIVDATHEDSLHLDAVEIEILDGYRDAARERLHGEVKKIEPAPTDPYAIPEKFKGGGHYQIWFRDAVTAASTDADIRKVHAAWNATSSHRKELVAAGQLVQVDITGLTDAFKAKRASIAGATDQIAAYSAFLAEGLSKAMTRDEADAFWRSTVAQRDGAGASEEVRAQWKRSWLDRKAGLAA
ncbi:hypothetical protein [Methylobacterium aquaticum]|uniref:hypothetical protein n=1 Tax=Methylobacterium aquaticum TaxID=270351 RepID=UPI0007C858B3|nr:hypothetical protein [Methylobacterium aquaticum]